MNYLAKVKSKLFLRITVFSIILIWCVGFISPIFYYKLNFLIISYPFTKYVYSLVCHQIGSKSFNINGENLLVCARCTGIYAGALFASLISIFYSFKMINNINLFLYSIIFLALDVFFTTAGIYHYSKLLAFFTGIFLGSVSFLYILNVIEINLLKETNGH